MVYQLEQALSRFGSLQVTSLYPPWGSCDQLARPYHACMADCRNLKAANMCGCRDVYMDDLDGG